MALWGYVRPDGSIGVRNHVLIISSVVCANEVTSSVSNSVPGTVCVIHNEGCGQLGVDYEQTLRTLIGFGRNPNVASVLVVGLGCEKLDPRLLADGISSSGKRVEVLVIQEEGGTIRAKEKGMKIAKELVSEASRMTREPIDLSSIVLALECGGSDATSGIAANPAMGFASDYIVKAGGTSILSETPEFIGAEHILAKRAINEEVARRIYEIVERAEKSALAMGVDLRGTQPTRGNIEGGITTIEEKSLGCIYKAGKSPIQGVLEYAELPKGKGLWIMDTPGHDVQSITGMVAGGAQVVLFSTGRGTPVGCPIAPVIKITGNPITYQKMKDNIDINAGTIILGLETIEEVGLRIVEELFSVVNGKMTKAEALGHREFAITRIGPTM